MRYYVKVADLVCGIGWSRGYWTRSGAERAAEDLGREFAPAVWIYTAKQAKAYERSEDA